MRGIETHMMDIVLGTWLFGQIQKVELPRIYG
jgi:hypothetical protein